MPPHAEFLKILSAPGHSVLYALGCAGGLVLLAFTFKLVEARLSFHQNVRQGLPMPKWNPIFGHLLVLHDLFKAALPLDIATPEIVSYLCRQNGEDDSPLYVDLWPFVPPILVVTSPAHARQVCEQHDLVKPDVLTPFLYPVVGGGSMFTANGAQWHHERSLFLPWFSSKRIASMTEKIVPEVQVLVEVLREHARSGQTFLLNQAISACTMDISGSVILNERLGCQLRDHPFASAMRDNMGWHYTGSPGTKGIRRGLLRPLMSWYNGRRMNQYILAVINRHLDTHIGKSRVEISNESLLDFVLSKHLKKEEDSGPSAPDIKFKRWLTAQLRLFMFTGHSSSAPTISFCHYLLSQSPLSMANLREEHTRVYGANPDDAAQRIRDQPTSLSQLPYTTAVIKETLRLFPPASSFRAGAPGVYLTDEGTNRRFPTEGMNVWVIHSALHRDPSVWMDAGTFLPERWLVGPDHPSYPAKGSFRPFERGSRDCLGQRLAMQSLKIIMVMTARLFDFQAAYGEVDREGVNSMEGERAYPIGAAGAQPADELPCRVTVRE